MDTERSIIAPPGVDLNKPLPKIKAVHPFNSTILVENLNPDEVLGTKLYVNKNAKIDSAPQAIIVEVGPAIKDTVALKVGDRVIIQGSYVPVANTGPNTERTRGIIEIHNIKAIIEEEAE